MNEVTHDGNLPICVQVLQSACGDQLSRKLRPIIYEFNDPRKLTQYAFDKDLYIQVYRPSNDSQVRGIDGNTYIVGIGFEHDLHDTNITSSTDERQANLDEIAKLVKKPIICFSIVPDSDLRYVQHLNKTESEIMEMVNDI